MQDTCITPASVADDRALLRLLEDHPRAGAAALYDRYGALIFTLALRIVGDRGAAEEITQDVFVRCWQNAARYRVEQGGLLTWLLSIAHHRAIDELRSRRHRARQREATFDESDAHALAWDGAHDLRLLQHEVRAALGDLPAPQREVIELLYYGGLTRQEAAERLNAPLGTVHTRIRLGMAKLRHTLAHLLDEHDDSIAAHTPSNDAGSASKESYHASQ